MTPSPALASQPPDQGQVARCQQFHEDVAAGELCVFAQHPAVMLKIVLLAYSQVQWPHNLSHCEIATDQVSQM